MKAYKRILHRFYQPMEIPLADIFLKKGISLYENWKSIATLYFADPRN